MSEFFATNIPNPPHWTQNSCFIVFHTIFVHLAPFDCVTKLSAKRAKLMQKFGPRSHVGIFCNERMWSTPLDIKLMFWCISYNLGAFWTVWLPYETLCKTGRTRAKVRASKSRRTFTTNAPDPPHWTIYWRFGLFVLFGYIRDCLVALQNSLQNLPN